MPNYQLYYTKIQYLTAIYFSYYLLTQDRVALLLGPFTLTYSIFLSLIIKSYSSSSLLSLLSLLLLLFTIQDSILRTLSESSYSIDKSFYLISAQAYYSLLLGLYTCYRGDLLVIASYYFNSQYSVLFLVLKYVLYLLVIQAVQRRALCSFIAVSYLGLLGFLASLPLFRHLLAIYLVALYLKQACFLQSSSFFASYFRRSWFLLFSCL